MDDDLPRIAGVGALVFDVHRRLLLVLRTKPPGQGTWSLPGGRVEPGEDAAAAVVREVVEETGLRVVVRRVVEVVELPAPGGGVYSITDLVCEPVGGTLAAGDDAGDAGWFAAADLAGVPVQPGLLDTLARWGLLPA